MSRVSAGGRRAFTLVELVLALVLGMVVLAGAHQVLLASQRFYRVQAAAVEVHQGLRAIAQVLSAELRELDASGGDVIALGADSLFIRAQRRLEFVCAAPDVARGRLLLRDDLSFGLRAVDPTRDRALIFRDGSEATSDDDGWVDAAISSTSGGRCEDGTPATGLALGAPATGLDSVTVGSPVRVYERVVYRAYADADGLWWLGMRTRDTGGWAAISPVAGPLAGRSGLVFAYFDAAGAPTARAADVARVTVALRGASSAVLQEVGGRQRRYADSLNLSLALRNGGRP